ncbi:hypothetical protein ABTX81_22775 [Kitasatospora sp. NPDC097605]|uniref:hypothetical protein n=1 Tax=Kitasatospora sp. NPDC097605 TaxID=3157226 RepID=UPI0033250B42
MDLKFATTGNRAAYPYLVQAADPGVMANRDQLNLNKAKNDGTVVTLARHHLLPYKDLVTYWNYTVDHYYQDDQTKVPAELQQFLSALIKYIESAPLAAITNKGLLKEFLGALKEKSLHHDGAQGAYMEQKEEFRQIFTWCPGNLIIGPTSAAGNLPGRVDDPHDGPETFLADEAGPPAVKQLLACREHLATGEDAETHTLRPEKLWALKQFYKSYRLLFGYGSAAVSYPQRVSDSAWDRIPADWYYVTKSIGRNGSPTRSDYGRNKTGNTLRQARSRSRNCPVRSVIPVDKTTVPELRTPSDQPSDINIGTVPVTLVVDGTWNDGGSDCTRYRASVHGVKMADILSWAAGLWKVTVDVPDWVRDLELRDASLEKVVSDQWASWKVGLGVAMDVTGATADAVVSLEWATGRKVAVGVQLAVRDRKDPDATPLLLTGGFTRTTADGWELKASLAAAEPIQLADLLRCFAISPDELPEELRGMAPAVTEADFFLTEDAEGQLLAFAMKTEHAEIALACSTLASKPA